MKILDGSALASYIKERQAKDVRSLFGTYKIRPKLAIIVTVDNPVIDIYIKLKNSYGQDIGIDVDIYRIKQSEVEDKLEELNSDKSVNGIIIQLPIENPEDTDRLVNLVNPDKDVDALGVNAKFDPATPTAILWLMAGYNVDFRGKKVLLIGKGKLVGLPLKKILENNQVDVEIVDREIDDLKTVTHNADIVISATGSPAIIYSDMIKDNAVVIDAGVASEDGKTVGDVADDVYNRNDLTITPKKGGVGPLTVCALFENVITSARRTATQTSK